MTRTLTGALVLGLLTSGAACREAAAPKAPPRRPPSEFAGGDLGDYPKPVAVGHVERAGNIPKANVVVIARTGTNRAVELTVKGMQFTAAVAGRQAVAGRRFAVIDTAWKNIIPLTRVLKHPEKQDRTLGIGGLGAGAARSSESQSPDDFELKPTPYVVPDLINHAFMTVNGVNHVTVSPATSDTSHPLPLDRLVVASPEAEVRGQLVFEIPDHDVASLEFRFFDAAYGDFSLLLQGTPPAAPTLLAGPARNEILELGVVGVREQADLAGRHAAQGQTFVEVQMTGAGVARGDLVRVDLARFASVRDEQGYSFAALQDAAMPGAFQGQTQFLPGLQQRGVLFFQVPDQHGALALAVNMPGRQPIELKLPRGSSDRTLQASVSPPILFTIVDGNTLDLAVHGLRGIPSPDGVAPSAGKRLVLLDVTILNKGASGIEFQTGEQLTLLNGQDRIRFDASATKQLAHPLSEGAVVPAHGRGRFELAFQVPEGASSLTLYYRGFGMDDRRPVDIR